MWNLTALKSIHFCCIQKIPSQFPFHKTYRFCKDFKMTPFLGEILLQCFMTGVFFQPFSFQMNFNDHINFPHTLLPVRKYHKYQHLTCWIIKVGPLSATATLDCWKVMSGYKLLCKVVESSWTVFYLHAVQHHACHHHPHPGQQVWEDHLEAD